VYQAVKAHFHGFLGFDTRQVSTPTALLGGRNPCYPLDRSPGGSQTWCGQYWQDKSSPRRKLISCSPVFQPLA